MNQTNLWQRRQFLASLGAAGAMAALPHSALAADKTYKPRRIDVHHHVLPPPYLEWEKLGNHHKRIYRIAEWAFYELGTDDDPLSCRRCYAVVQNSDEAFDHVSQALDALDKKRSHYNSLTELPGAPDSMVRSALDSLVNDVHYVFEVAYHERT